MNFLEDIVNYAYVGLFPNTIGALCTYRDAPRALEELAHGKYAHAAILLLPAVANLIVGYSKYAEYKQVKNGLQKHGWSPRIVKPKLYSWCQRHAARQAATQLGYGQQFDRYARSEGHRWYHFLPKIHRINEVV